MSVLKIVGETVDEEPCLDSSAGSSESKDDSTVEGEVRVTLSENQPEKSQIWFNLHA